MTKSDTSAPFRFRPASLASVGEPTFEDWAAAGHQLRVMRDHSPWWLGDWWLFGERRYGEVASQEAREELERETGSKYSTVRVAAWVASHYPVDARVTGVSFRHHQEVAVLEPTVRHELLCRTRDEDWTIARLRHEAGPYRRLLKQRRAVTDQTDIVVLEGDSVTVLPALEQQFALLIADPFAGGDPASGPGIDVASAKGWLGGALECLTPDHHVFLFAHADDLPDLELELRSLDLPIQSRIVWCHQTHVSQHVAGGLAHVWSPILHIGTHGLCHDGVARRSRIDIQRFASLERAGEYTAKPFDLVLWLVAIGSKPGDAVLDLFGGDATTAMECRELGRHCTVIERDPVLASVIRQRVVGSSFEDEEPPCD